MKAKEYLQQIREQNRKIDMEVQTLSRYRRMAFSVSNDVTQPKYNPNRPTSATYEKYLAEADALDREICEMIDELADMKDKARNIISRIDSTELEMILEMRYLNYMTWDAICDVMGYGKSWVHKKHGEALNRMDAFME